MIIIWYKPVEHTRGEGELRYQTSPPKNILCVPLLHTYKNIVLIIIIYKSSEWGETFILGY